MPAFGDKTLIGIAPTDVLTWLANHADSYAPATTRKAFQLLSAAMQAAVDDGLIGQTPCRGMTLPRLEHRESRYLDNDQIGRLIAATPDRYQALVATAAYAGLRWGELAALRKSDLDLLRKRLTVRQTTTSDRGKVCFGPPKTKASRRAVTLSPNLVAIIANHMRRFPSQSGLVFTSARGSVLRDTNFRRRHWQPALERVGLEGLHFHDLRHSHVALLIAAGEHPKKIQSRLGHSSIQVTLDRYGHLFDGLDESAADALDHLISVPDVRILRESDNVVGLH